MWMDQVLNPAPPALESDGLQTALWNGTNKICSCIPLPTVCFNSLEWYSYRKEFSPSYRKVFATKDQTLS